LPGVELDQRELLPETSENVRRIASGHSRGDHGGPAWFGMGDWRPQPVQRRWEGAMAAAGCSGGMAASCKLMASSMRAMGALRRGSRLSRRQTERAPRLYLRTACTSSFGPGHPRHVCARTVPAPPSRHVGRSVRWRLAVCMPHEPRCLRNSARILPTSPTIRRWMASCESVALTTTTATRARRLRRRNAILPPRELFTCT
jgi:hypothetical protein